MGIGEAALQNRRFEPSANGTLMQTDIPLRSPAAIMTPARLGSFKATRLSFGPALIARAIRERWEIHRDRWDLDAQGRGIASYIIKTPRGHIFTFLIDSLMRSYDEKYSDENYGRQFDAGGTLVEGQVTDAFIQDFRSSILRMPFDGRADRRTLAWARMNRSTRCFKLTVDTLAAGLQPNVAELCGVGYLLRSAQFHANGMCGMRLFSQYEREHPLAHPFAPQALAAYLTREFGNDLVDHLAAHKGGIGAARLHPGIKRFMGIGNGTGIGLIIFTRNHPRLLDRWITIRETALALATAQKAAPGSAQLARFQRILTRFYEARRIDEIPYGETFLSGPELAKGLEPVLEITAEFDRAGTIAGTPADDRPWPLLRARLQDMDSEVEESVNTALIDTYPETTDPLLDFTIVRGVDEFNPEIPDIDTSMTLRELRTVLRNDFSWAFKKDALAPEGQYWTWYWSTTGEYPGVLSPAELTEVEPFAQAAGDVPTQAQRLAADIDAAGLEGSLAVFLMAHPQHRNIVRWLQITRACPYGALYMNMRARDFHPARPSRFMLEAIKGFERFQPTRRYAGGTVIFLQGAPLRDDIAAGTDDIWAHPVFPVL